MTAVELYAHPASFDLDPAAAATAIAACDVEVVRLAAVYHGGRWLLSTTSPGRVLHLEDSVAQVALGERGEDWDLRPAAASSVARGREPFGEAAAALRARGVTTGAWLVALHSTPAAMRRPDLALSNVFGVRYRHALCPAQPEVADHAVRLAGAVADRDDVDFLDIEALAYLGWAHDGLHEKVGVRLRPVDRWLLSLCFCSACRRRLERAGVDVERSAARGREALERHLRRPEAGDPSEPVDEAIAGVLGAETYAAVLDVRDDVVAGLAERVARRAAKPITLRATADRHHVRGKAAGDLGRLGRAAGAVTLSALGGDVAALERELELAERAGIEAKATSLAISVQQPHVEGPDAVAALAARLARTGVGRVAAYAFDLAPAGAVRSLAAALLAPRIAEAAA